MNRGWLYTLIGVAVLAVLSYATFIALQPEPLPQGFFYGSGHIEGTEVRVVAEVPGRIVENRLVEGRPVTEGELLIRLDDTQLEDRVEASKAELRALEQRAVGVEAQRQIWTHHLEVAQRNYDRYEALTQRNAVPSAELDQAANRLAEARGRAASLAAERTALTAQAEAATRGAALIESDLAKARITAPQAGWVQIKAAERGEVAAPGQLLAVLVDLSRVELKVYLPGPQVGRVRLGAQARVRVDAFPDRYFEARVERTDPHAQFTPRDIHLPEERVQMVYGVTLVILNPGSDLRPGMPADAWIQWDASAPWPEHLPVPR